MAEFLATRTADPLTLAVFLAGCVQLSVLSASALVPSKLEWKGVFERLPTLHRQLYWTYGGYTAGAILLFGLMAAGLPGELASGTPLARALCGYLCLFWLVRLLCAPWLATGEYLTNAWFKAGYALLHLAFVLMTVTYGAAAVL